MTEKFTMEWVLKYYGKITAERNLRETPEYRVEVPIWEGDAVGRGETIEEAIRDALDLNAAKTKEARYERSS
jgi:hypothetical protein